MRYLDTLRAKPEPPVQQRAGFEDYLNLLNGGFGGFSFDGAPLGLSTLYSNQKVETLSNDFPSYVNGIYKRDGVVFGVSAARELLISETTFKFRQLSDKSLFGTPALSLLEQPWTNGTTGDLLKRMEQDATLSGNAYVVKDGDRLRRLNPGRVGIMLSSASSPEYPQWAYDTELVCYLYAPNASPPLAKDAGVTVFFPEEVAHWTPTPDPEAQFRGMSWLTPVLREIATDMAITQHEQKFFENGATPNLVVKFPESLTDPDQFAKIKERLDASHAGAANAYRTLYLMAGADVSVVGAATIDFKSLKGIEETRICMAARVPASVAGASEGLAGSSLNAGNYTASRRQFVDAWYHPTVKDLAATLSKFVQVPAGSQLWYDTSDIAYLREDEQDAATIRQTDALTIRQYTDAGFTPDSAIAAVKSGDPGLLQHTGLFSVQLQPPGAQAPTPDGASAAA